MAARGVNISVVRLAPPVHAEGDHGFVPMLIGIARQKGISVYQDESPNYWAAVHRLDAARLYRLALEKAAPAGIRYHASAEQGIAFQDIAAAIGRGLNIPVTGKTKEEAALHFGSFAHFAAMDVQASSEETQRVLGWQPGGPDLIRDIETVYFRS